MTPTIPIRDLAAQWSSARQLYPIYFELAREFSIEVEAFAGLETQVETPDEETVAQANQWLDRMDGLIRVHQLRQFLQTSSLVNPEGLVVLIQHFLAKPVKDAIVRDKVDFLLVQYFSQQAPSGVDDALVDLPYVASALERVLGEIELKPPVWLNGIDRVLESSRRCRSLDELLHGGILDQGRKAKDLAGDLYYLPIALAAFTRFGYLIRRSFFRLMLGDLNAILDGLNELEEKGVATIDCRRAQFSAQEPIVRLRMICQSWKVMFQAEYSSGQPLRMLVDLRAAVDFALGRGQAAAAEDSVQDAALKDRDQSPAKTPARGPSRATTSLGAAAKGSDVKAAAAKAAPANLPLNPHDTPASPEPAAPETSASAAKASVGSPAFKSLAKPPTKSPATRKPGIHTPASQGAAPEFEVSLAPEWNAEASSPSASPSGKKKS